MKKIYIAGPITKVADRNASKKRFAEVAAEITARGDSAVNPHVLCAHINNNAPWLSFMIVCIPALIGCDEVYALSDWMDSKGATIEVNLATSLGIPVVVER